MGAIFQDRNIAKGLYYKFN